MKGGNSFKQDGGGRPQQERMWQGCSHNKTGKSHGSNQTANWRKILEKFSLCFYPPLLQSTEEANVSCDGHIYKYYF